jgi:hypothetical protein
MVTVLTLGAAMTVGTTASAAPADTGSEVGTQAWWDCPDGYFCAWYNVDGIDRGGNNTPEFYGKSVASDLTDFDLNDHVFSVWNRTGVVWCAYPDINHSDVNGSAAPNPWPVGNWRGNTSQYGMQNAISSLRRGAC